MTDVTIGDCRLILGDAFEVLPTLALGPNAHVICDPPFSARTHTGHDEGAKSRRDGAERNGLGYEPWTPEMVGDFVQTCHCAGVGWMACFCDHTLAPEYMGAMRRVGRYVFAPLPYYAPGRSVRLTGDGPSSWTDWIVVSRTTAQRMWGTLPGGYSPKTGWGQHEHMGGKPLGLMREIVRDYSKEGDTVIDPVAGSGTTGLAAISLGRKAILIEKDPQTFEVMRRRIEVADGKGGLFAAAFTPDLWGGTSGDPT